MLKGLNRQQRRHAAKRWAPELARSFLQVRAAKDQARHAMEPVHGEMAIQALTRAIAQMIITSEPHCIRLTLQETRGFPEQCGADLLIGDPWLAVGIDCDGRASYVLRYVESNAEDKVSARRSVEIFMFRELSKLCATSGFGASGDPKGGFGSFRA